MASRRTAIMDAAFTALGSATVADLASPSTTYTRPASLTVYRTHPAALKAANLPAIVVRRAQEESVVGPNRHKARRSFYLAVDCYVGSASQGETIEDALDLLTSWAVQAISNTATLQGGTGMVAISTRDVLTKWEESDMDAVYARATIAFLSDYITAAGNPDAA